MPKSEFDAIVQFAFATTFFPSSKFALNFVWTAKAKIKIYKSVDQQKVEGKTHYDLRALCNLSVCA